MSGNSDVWTLDPVLTEQYDLRPRPQPGPLSEAYWRAADNGSLVIQRCTCCRHWSHPPTFACVRCGSQSLEFEPVSGRGTIHQLVIVRQSRLEGFESRTPYLVAAVELDEQPGLVLIANLVDQPIETTHVGQRVFRTFERVGPDVALPQFSTRPRP